VYLRAVSVGHTMNRALGLKKALLSLAVPVLGLALLLSAIPASAHLIPSPCDWVTGGGFVINDGAHANFGLVAGCKHHHFFGHVNFIDHSLEVHVSCLTITVRGTIHPVCDHISADEDFAGGTTAA
jgi:hypothetical protein